MNNRGGIFVFFLILFGSAIVFLQIHSMLQADRFHKALEKFVDNLIETESPAGIGESVDEDDTGDWLIWSLSAEPGTLNPMHTAAGVYTMWVVKGYVSNNIFEGLLKYDIDEMRLKPHLAESYNISNDGLEITFKLRDDIHFSDGVPITTDDVIFTYETIVDPNIDAASVASYYEDVEKVVKISDREVKFVMKRPYFKSLEVACLDTTGVMPKHIYQFDDPQEFNDRISNPIGSGPYVFEKWNVGQEIVLRRNENYWGKKPKLKKIVYRIILNNTAAIQALRSGEIDFVRPLPDQYFDLARDEEFKKDIQMLSYWTPFAGYFWIGYNQDRPFFKDRKVRLALTHIVDREAIVKSLLKVPDAEVPTGPFYIKGRQSDQTINPWPYDPEKAKRLLDEAGWIDTDGDGIRDKDGVPFRFKYMIVSGTYLHDQIVKLVKDQAARVGIDIIAEPYEWSVFQQRLLDRNFDAVNLAWHGVVHEDPYQIWHSSQIGGRGSNYVGFNVPLADHFIEEARKTLNERDRNKLYHRFHRIIHEQQPYTFIYTRPEQRLLHKRFKNVKTHAMGLNIHEWYVPKEKQKYK